MKTQTTKHYFNAPIEDKDSRFCQCGKYLTDKIHFRVKIVEGKQITY